MRAIHFGTATDYKRALAEVMAEGVPEKHLELLKAHFQAPGHIRTMRQLAAAVGYANYSGVNLQYGTFARRIANRLGVVAPPHGFWLFVLVDWVGDVDSRGDTLFVLRAPVVTAIKRLAFPWAKQSSTTARIASPHRVLGGHKPLTKKSAAAAMTSRVGAPISIKQFIHAIAALSSDRPHGDPSVWYRTQKEHWLGWLGTYNEPGAYDRRPDSGRDARFVYNHIVNPQMLLWLIEAARLARGLVRAAKAADRRAGSMPEASSSIRRLVPWEVTQAALTFPKRLPKRSPKVAQEAVARLRQKLSAD